MMTAGQVTQPLIGVLRQPRKLSDGTARRAVFLTTLLLAHPLLA
jgi:hypothetical protein